MSDQDTQQDTRTATEIAEQAPKNVIGVPAVATYAPDHPRAQTRSVYLDSNGRRRNVAAGAPIPEGWEHVEDVDHEARAAATVTARDGGDEDTGSGGADRGSSSGGGSRRRRSSSSSSGEGDAQ
jgi:hypothetical protein